jgi:hypothetical protein
MPGDNDKELDFEVAIRETLEIPGVTKKMIADWVDVDPSTVTRWCRGTHPTEPLEVLKRLEPHVARMRKEVASVRRTEVDSWRSLCGDLDPGIRDYVDQTGLLASSYYVIASWIPSSRRSKECDVVILRHFSGVWADMSRSVYNIGDQDQTVSFTDGEEGIPGFDQPKALGEIADIGIRMDKEVGRSVVRLHIQLNLERFKHPSNSIGFIDSFGYRFRATRAIATEKQYVQQTTDFLGAPIVLTCRRFNLIVCIPSSCFRGAPSALSSSNRSMLRVLMDLDNAEPDVIESLLWPRGCRHEMSNAPDAPLKRLPRMVSTIEGFPHPLQEALNQPADLTLPDESIRDVLCSPESACFLLDLHAPHPSLTSNIVWRLPD